MQRRYTVDASLFRPRADFLLRVRGLSMINAGILDGDLLAVHRSSEARNGQIVVARLDDEVTVKPVSYTHLDVYKRQVLRLQPERAGLDAHVDVLGDEDHRTLRMPALEVDDDGENLVVDLSLIHI